MHNKYTLILKLLHLIYGYPSLPKLNFNFICTDMKTKISLLLFAMTLTACNFSKSAKIDLITGLTTTGDLISCDDIYLTVNEQKVNSSTFTYGDEFLLNFNNIEGFTRENERVFPGMDLYVTGLAGDTLLVSKDLYKNYPDGINLASLMLQSKIIAATPIHSNGEYTLFVKIWDKKGSGTFNAKLNFKVAPSDKIVITPEKLSYKEIYLFSNDSKRVINDSKIKVHENVYLLFEGLSGFKEVNGFVFAGLSIKASDEIGEQLVNYEDLFAENSEKGFSVSDIYTQVSSKLVFSSFEIKNPIHCKIVIWDKKSDAKISTAFDLILTQ